MELAATNLNEIALVARDAGWLEAHETIVAAEPAGDGNMNRTLRITTADRSLVLKQSLPYVAKYPDIPAPHDRDRVEAAFYRAIADNALIRAAMPAFIGHVPEEHLLCFEDLGTAADYTSAYIDGNIDGLDVLGGWLSALHELTPTDPVFENTAMRELNHAHIFEIPFVADNGVDLDGITLGLRAMHRVITDDDIVINRARSLGERYRATTAGVLLHGDFYPGSWLKHSDGPKVIDPEFGFVGPAEFDVGVLLAHMVLTGNEPVIPATYHAPGGFDRATANAYAGIEILRRLLGVAQLPLVADIRTKGRWIDMAVEMATA